MKTYRRSWACALCGVLLANALTGAGESARRISTFLGGGGVDYGASIACHPDGHVFVAVSTTSGDFPVPEDQELPPSAGGQDVIVAKLSPDLSRILAVKMLGGWGDDVPCGILLNAEGNLVIAGTATGGFPTTPFQPESSGGKDIFISVLRSDSLDVIYSTVLGGSGDDQAFRARLDERGVVTVVGYTTAPDFPLMSPFQPQWGGGGNDTIVAQLLPDGRVPREEQLVYSTLLGGNGLDWGPWVNYCQDISISPDGLIAVFLLTDSTDMPLKSPIQAGYQGSFSDAIPWFVRTDNGVVNARGRRRQGITVPQRIVVAWRSAGPGSLVNGPLAAEDKGDKGLPC